MSALADGSIAISGSFYRQVFQIPQGSSVRGPSVDVVVFNQGSEPMLVRMVTEAPAGVEIVTSRDRFELQPGSQEQMYVEVQVTTDAVPGTYPIGVIAESYREESEGGITVLASAALRNTVEVIGESAIVTVNSVSPSGQPIVASIRLFKVVGGISYEFAYDITSSLTAEVSPGSYIAYAYSITTTEKLAEQAFEVASGENKVVMLTVDTIYFESFAVNRFENSETGEIGWAQIVYTLNNAYQPMPSAEVKLIVTLNGAQLEEVSILTMNPLVIGRMGAPYNYTPSGGWQDGTYGFSLRLLINGEPYASTNEKTLDVDVPGGSSSLLFIILGIIGGGLLLGILIFAVARRRKKGEKPEKAAKAKKKAKVKVDKKAKAKKEAPAPVVPSPGVDILFDRGMPEVKDAEEAAPGLAKTAAGAPSKEGAKAAAPPSATAATKPGMEKPSVARPSEGASGLTKGPAVPKKEGAPPGAASGPSHAPQPTPPTGVRPADAKPVQAAGAPKPGEGVKPVAPAPPAAKLATDAGAAKPAAPSAPPKTGEPLHKPGAEPAKPAGPQPTVTRPIPPTEPARPAEPAAPRVVVPPVIKPPAEREAPKPPSATPPVRGAEGTAAPPVPGRGREADALRQMPSEKAGGGKPDLKLVSALEQRMSRVRREGQPGPGKPGGEGTRPVGDAGLFTPRPAGDRPVAGAGRAPEVPAAEEEPAGDEPSGTAGTVPEKTGATDEASAAVKPASTEDQKAEGKDQAGKDDDEEAGKTDKKFTSPIRFLNQ